MRTRFSLLSILLVVVLGTFAAPRASAQQSEYIIVSGGPALRKFEDLRRPGEQHDRWWGNFVRTARTRIEDLQKATHTAGTQFTWLVYQDAYARRSDADKQNLMSNIVSVRDKYHLKLVYYHSGSEVIDYINRGMNRSRTKISGFEYFGHSNKYAFLMDYSSANYGTSACWLHENNLSAIHSSAFYSNAYCQSWGCHTGESMSAAWKKATGVWMIGAYGKTDYSDLHLRANHVGLSAGAHWRTRG